MRAFLLAAVLSCAAVASAAPHIVAFSTQRHFRCQLSASSPCDQVHTQTISSIALSSLVHQLSGSVDEPADATLPLVEADTFASKDLPEVILLISSNQISHPVKALNALSAAAPSSSASAFHAYAQDPATDDDIDNLSVNSRTIGSVEELAKVASDLEEGIFNNGQSEVLFLRDVDVDESALGPVVHALSERSNNKLVVIWSARQGNTDADAAAVDGAAGEAPKADPAAQPAAEPASQPGTAPAEEPAAAPKDASSGGSTESTDSTAGAPEGAQPRDGDGAPPQADEPADPNKMLPPPINAAQLAGLMVGAMFFTIFLPGLFCLWRIQSPQAFTSLDGNDIMKKTQ